MKTEFQRKKGFVYTLEVLVAVGIVVVVAVAVFRSFPEKTQTDIATLKVQGFHALKYLDDTEVIRKYISGNNESVIENELKAILPSTINFEAEICGTSCSSLNVPENKDVVSIDYYVAGYRSEYLERRIKLWLWKK
ncbi:MAG: hypothetical protein HYW27_01430 [Candidatus Aenigmarchaeota archaeon]|nr:hypothetical protein [Candidatus Aenigmarchaeota archaeon]